MPQKQSINKYSSENIEILEGLEPVRKRPGMYIGGIDSKALHHLVIEILDNSIDEVINNFANNIEVELLNIDTVQITDNGRGIPVDPHPKFKNKSALEIILTTLHSGGKFNSENYQTSGGLHGVGASVVSALDAEAFRETGIVIKPYQPAIFHRLSIIQPASGPSSPVVLDFIDTFIESLQPFRANSTAIS